MIAKIIILDTEQSFLITNTYTIYIIKPNKNKISKNIDTGFNM